MTKIFGIIFSLLITITPPSEFMCGGEKLNATIYNNLNGDYQINTDLENIDYGAFVVLKWKDFSIMIPRTFNAGEISFSDRRWWWSYQDKSNPLDTLHPRLRHMTQKGEIEEYPCEGIDYLKDA